MKIAYIALAILCYIVPKHAICLTASLSQTDIVKSHNFSGATIGLSFTLTKPQDVVVVVTGPLANYRLWHKNKKLGIWRHTRSLRLFDVPSYNLIASSYNKAELDDALRIIQETFYYGNIEHFTEVNTSTMHKSSIFKQAVEAFKHIQYNNGSMIYRSNYFDKYSSNLKLSIPIPDDALYGLYKVKIYTFEHMKVVDTLLLYFTVSKDKIYAELDALAKNYPLFYGMLSIIIAIIPSIFIHFISRRRTRTARLM